MKLISKINTLVWYLTRPSYLKNLMQLARSQMFYPKKEKTKEESEVWCNERAISSTMLLTKFGIDNADPVEDVFEEIFKVAHEKADLITVKMGGKGCLDLLYHLSEHISATRVVETGVAYGWSTLSILLSLSKRVNSLLVSTDMPYAKMGNESFVGCVVPEVLYRYWTLIRLPDINGLPKALAKFNSIDLCHYDSDKSYVGRKWAYPLLWGKLRKGGYFVSDDIGDNIGFKDFCDQINTEPYVVKMGNQYVGVIVK